LKTAFPQIIPVKRPSGDSVDVFNPYWLAGFASGECCFYVKINNSSSYRVGFKVILMFRLTQHARDEQLMQCLIKYLGCGSIYKDREAFEYRVQTISDIENKIIPFFQKYKILGVKYKDFEDWCKVAEIMKEGKHLTLEGLEDIRKIKAGMNSGRKFS